ncbi:MAG TPA: ABC transporter permease [Solirubrobacterales bacterium]|nr:ABC transporter permease [Solirubrobacterales bacterium]
MAEGTGAVIAAPLVPAFLGSFGGAIDFIFNQRESVQAGGQIGGLGQIWDLASTQIAISVVALLLATAIALPIGLWLGHRGVGEFLAVAVGNAGRAIPELALIALMVAFIGTGNLNVTIAVTILGIPPILTNAFVGVRQVDRGVVDAARGMGMSELAIIARVELPLAIPTIMGGVRTAMVNIIATSTIGSLAGVKTLGDLILGPALYGDEGVIAGAIVVALLALTFELILAGLQRLLTPRGLVLQRAAARASA